MMAMMMLLKQVEDREARLAERARLESVARWLEEQATKARRRGDDRDVQHFSKGALVARRRQR